MPQASIPKGYEGKVTLAVKDGDGDWWVKENNKWKCVTSVGGEWDNLKEIENLYLLEDID